MDQGSALQGVADPLLPEIPAGETAQLVVHERCEFLERPPVPVAPVSQQLCDLMLGFHGRIIPYLPDYEPISGKSARISV